MQLVEEVHLTNLFFLLLQFQDVSRDLLDIIVKKPVHILILVMLVNTSVTVLKKCVILQTVVQVSTLSNCITRSGRVCLHWIF